MVWTGDRRGKLAPCLVVMVREIDARAPNRDRASDGSIGNAEHQSRTSDHNIDENGWVKALDVTDDPAHFDSDDFAHLVIANRDDRIAYIIQDRLIWRSYPSKVTSRNVPVNDADTYVEGGYRWLRAWCPAVYSGSNTHEKHVHFSVRADRIHDTRTWFPQEDDMPLTPDEIDRIADRAADRVWNRPITDTRPGVNINASPRLVLGEMFMRSRQASSALAKLAGVSEDEIVAGILEGLSPERIAEAIPDTIAKDVADELARRLAE